MHAARPHPETGFTYYNGRGERNPYRKFFSEMQVVTTLNALYMALNPATSSELLQELLKSLAFTSCA